MPSATEQTAPRPFHETIVEAINSSSYSGLGCLASLITATRIPKGHDEIGAAWTKQRQRLGITNDLGVTASLLAQKAAAAEEARAKDEKKKMNLNEGLLDDLQRETQKLFSFLASPRRLTDYDLGLRTPWIRSLEVLLAGLHKLTSQALGK